MRLAAVLLAGGRSARMGGQDKTFALLHGKPLLEHVLAILERQADTVLISSNRPAHLFAQYGHTVLADCMLGHQGPLAGLLTAMMWSQRYHPRVTHLLSAPCDVPYLPPDIANRLKADLIACGATIAVARDDGGLHPTIGLWPVSLVSNLANDLIGRGMHGMQAWIRQFAIAQTDLNSHHLQNINTPEDLSTAHVEPRFQGDRL